MRDPALDYESLIDCWRREQEQPFSGWDFSYLDGRMLEETRPWSYQERATELMQQSASVLDMGTGGGERMLDMQESWPPRVVVTEDHSPNVKIARGRLEPLGVVVREVGLTWDDPMPFGDREFELVINRHAGFNCAEVARILATEFTADRSHIPWRDFVPAQGKQK